MTLKTDNIQLGANSVTPTKNIVIANDTSTGDLVFNKGNHDGVLTEINRILNDGSVGNLAASSGASLVGYMPAGVGAVPTDVQSKLQNIQSWEVNVKDAPAYAIGNGAADDSAAITLAEAQGNSVTYPAGTYYIGGSGTFTFSKFAIFMPGAKIVSNRAIVFSKGLYAGKNQIFDVSGNMSICNVDALLPEWWGAVADWNAVSNTGTDSTIPLQRCFNTVRAAQRTSGSGYNSDTISSVNGCGVIKPQRGQYRVTSTINLWSSTKILGEGYGCIPGAIFFKDFDGGPLFDCWPLNYGVDGTQYNNDSGEFSCSGMIIKGRRAIGTNTGDVFKLHNAADGVALFGGTAGPLNGSWIDWVIEKTYIEGVQGWMLNANTAPICEGTLDRVTLDVTYGGVVVSGATTGRVFALDFQAYRTSVPAFCSTTTGAFSYTDSGNCRYYGVGSITNANIYFRNSIYSTAPGKISISADSDFSQQTDGSTVFGGPVTVTGAKEVVIGGTYENINNANSARAATAIDILNCPLVTLLPGLTVKVTSPYGGATTNLRMVYVGVDGTTVTQANFAFTATGGKYLNRSAATVAAGVYSDYYTTAGAIITGNIFKGAFTQTIFNYAAPCIITGNL